MSYALVSQTNDAVLIEKFPQLLPKHLWHRIGRVIRVVKLRVKTKDVDEIA